MNPVGILSAMNNFDQKLSKSTLYTRNVYSTELARVRQKSRGQISSRSSSRVRTGIDDKKYKSPKGKLELINENLKKKKKRRVKGSTLRKLAQSVEERRTSAEEGGSQIA